MPFTLVSGSFCSHFSGSTSFFCFRANHLPTKRRVATVMPNFDEELEVSLLCKVTSKKWFNIVRDIKRCPKIFDRKKRSKKKIEHAGIEELLLFVNLIVTAIHKNNTLTKMKNHTWMETMIWFVMILKRFLHRLLIWIPWWNSVWKIPWRHKEMCRTRRG